VAFWRNWINEATPKETPKLADKKQEHAYILHATQPEELEPSLVIISDRRLRMVFAKTSAS
jgi:hypothetical protein